MSYGAEAIMRLEKQTVRNAITTNRMPTPSGETWDAIVSKYNLPQPVKIDSVLSQVTLPEGWSVSVDPDDYYQRCTIIKNEKGIKVGSYFLKNSGYDYYGHTSFNAQALE